MKPFALALVAALALVGCKAKEPKVSALTSPGGVAFTLVEMPGVDDVAIEVAWPTDWAWRAEVNPSVPYVAAEAILTGGAEGYGPAEVGERFADMEAEAHVQVAPDHVFGELLVPPEHLDEAVAIANAHLRAPRFDPVWVDRARSGLIDQLTELEDNPQAQGGLALRWALLGDIPLRAALGTGSVETLEAVTEEDLQSWLGQTLTATPTTITVAGEVGAEAAGKAVDALLAGLPAPRAPHAGGTGVVTPDVTPRRILLHMPGAELSQLTFVGPLPPTRTGGELADIVLLNALGGDDQSLLFDAVRTQLRASYAFGAGHANYARDTRLFVMSGAVEAGKLAEAETLVRETYAGFLETGPAGNLADRLAPMRAFFEEQEGFVDSVAFTEVLSQLDGAAPGRSLELDGEIADLTQEALLDRLATAWPDPDALVVMAVSPDADALPGACVITAPAEAMGCR